MQTDARMKVLTSELIIASQLVLFYGQRHISDEMDESMK